jgi:hypothetical protein
LFRLFKLGIALMGFMAFAWFGATVKLGSQTLFQHLRAIGQTKESQELLDGTKQAAAPLVDDVRRHIGSKTETATAPSPDAGAPEERLSSSERHQLHRLIRKVDR